MRVDIPDESDPDHARLHGQHETIANVMADAAGEETGDERDSQIYRVELDDGGTEDLRHHDLRPPLDE